MARLALVLSTTLALTCGVLTGKGGATDKTSYKYIHDGLVCIHHGEGAWNANTGNGYYGGLQMDYGFMRAYGREYLQRFGTADKWPWYVQLAVGMKAYFQRGWYPWPNTARNCGLL